MHRIVTLIDLSVKMEQHLASIDQKMNKLQLPTHQEPQIVDVVWLDNQDVMQKLNISNSTLKRRRLEGIIPCTRIKGKYFYQEEDIQKLLKTGLNG
jgi:hypothetical protein